MISVGANLPTFRLQNQDGQWTTRENFPGKWLVIYVYPKDDTPGCTVQGKSFTARKEDFERIGAHVLGLSEDDVVSHKAFCNKFSFSIDLLADPNKTFLKDLGIGQSEWKGTMYWDRTTVIADATGVVRKVYENVNPTDHEKILLEDLKKLMS